MINGCKNSAAMLAAFALYWCGAGTVLADADHGESDPRPDDHAPIGVMGDHRHAAGEWMLSYRFMRMDMAGNRVGTDSISPEAIATTIPNRFSERPGQPPTLRVVPTEMTMDMHMFGWDPLESTCRHASLSIL